MTQTQTAVKLSKKDQALRLVRRIKAASKDFDFNAKGNREKVVAQLKAKIDLSEGGASTYYANMKNGTPGWSLDVQAVKAKPVVKAKKVVNG